MSPISWATRVKAAAEESRKPSPPPIGAGSFGGKATSFFITNFPEIWSSSDIWKELSAVGKIVDLFIPTKRNKAGRKFGFARFFGVSDVGKFEQQLNGVWMNKLRLKANLARFERGKQSSNKQHRRHINTVIMSPSRVGGRNGSFVDVLKGPPPPPHLPVQQPELKGPKTVNILTSVEMKDKMSRSLVGELKSFENLRFFYTLVESEGWQDISISYTGGLQFLLSFRIVQAAEEFLVNGANTWKAWFKLLAKWDPQGRQNRRIAVISITGIPPNAWTMESFTEIGRLWGEVLHCSCIGESKIRDKAKVTILTNTMHRIEEKVLANIDDFQYFVKASEVDSDLELVTPIDAMDGTGSSNESEEEDNGVWDDDIGFSDQENGVDNQPATVPESHPVDSVRVSKIRMLLPRKNNDDSEPGASLKDAHAAPVAWGGDEKNGSPESGQSRSDRVSGLMGSGSYNLNQEINQAHYNEANPPNLNGEGSEQDGCGANETGNIQFGADSGNKINPTSLEPHSKTEDDIEDANDSIDLAEEASMMRWDEKMHRAEKRKRDLKMKRIASPCNCKPRSKTGGKICRHSNLVGGVSGKVYIADRDENGQSDSESFIRCSNHRILEQAVTQP
ncbi:hypothetical protein LXL04_031222 [Taraxacum kok-saghyz]